MPPKRRKFESTFPAARIKKIMQLDDDVGRVASSVPVVISRAVEIFLHALLTRAADYACSRNAKTLTVGHLKHCIEQEKQWDFLKELTAKISDVAAQEDAEDATSSRRGRKRKGSPAVTAPHIPVRRKRKQATHSQQQVPGLGGEATGSGSSDEEEGGRGRLGGGGTFSQYFSQPAASSSSTSTPSLAHALVRDKQEASTSSSPNNAPPSLLTSSLLSAPSSSSLLSTPSSSTLLSTNLTSFAGLHSKEEEEDDYDA